MWISQNTTFILPHLCLRWWICCCYKWILLNWHFVLFNYYFMSTGWHFPVKVIRSKCRFNFEVDQLYRSDRSPGRDENRTFLKTLVSQKCHKKIRKDTKLLFEMFFYVFVGHDLNEKRRFSGLYFCACQISLLGSLAGNLCPFCSWNEAAKQT